MKFFDMFINKKIQTLIKKCFALQGHKNVQRNFIQGLSIQN